MTLLVFNINGKTPQEKERLKSSVNWNETLITNLRTLGGILFGPNSFWGIKGHYIFNFCFINGVEKKWIYID